MDLLVEGLSYRGAPLAVRERVFLSGDGLRGGLRRLAAQDALSGGAILSTCNRTELYVTTAEPERAAAQLDAVVAAIDPSGEWPRHSYRLSRERALEHLFRVPSGLDSAILGEGQILGQFKGALASAVAEGTVDARLDLVMRRAISAAKRVRTETGITRNAVGFGQAAVAQAREIFGSLRGRTALMVGAGKMAGSTARLLAGEGMARVHFSTRTPARAMELAAEMPAGTISLTVPFSQVEQLAAEVDLIVCSTSAEDTLFTRSMIEEWMRRRRRRPLFILDLAVPRDVDPAAAGIGDLYLFNVDDLAAVVDRGLAERRREVPAAEAILREEIAAARELLRRREAAPAIAALRQSAEALRREHLRRHLPPGLTPDQAEAVERMSAGLVARLLHGPIAHLRDHADDEPVVRRLLGLEPPPEGLE
ncbi:MAG TPA: glutamyl-tRNA reductase [Candidatus Dormibacteraeota bacterium]|nr:glutamyl-tRNA reductase [Candidatus Dormibacteraeota bacterium]